MVDQPDNEVEEVRLLEDLVSALGAIEDPADRFRRAGKLLEAWTDQQQALKQMRQQIITDLRKKKVSYRTIAQELKISVARVQQIEKGESTSARERKRARAKASTPPDSEQ